MKKNKGFTMVEVLAVIAILATILAISAPQVFETIERNRQKSLDIFIENIKTAAEGYFADADVRIEEGLDNDDGTTNWGTTITLEDLVNAGFFKKPIKNPKTEKIINPEAIKIAINYNENKTLDIEVGYGKDTLLIVPKIWHISKDSTIPAEGLYYGVKRYDEEGIEKTNPVPTPNNISSSDYNKYNIKYDMGLGDEKNPQRTIYISDKLSSIIPSDSEGNGMVPGNEFKYLKIIETSGEKNYLLMSKDKQGIKVVRDEAFESEMCWKQKSESFCSNYFNYLDSNVYTILNNNFLPSIVEKKKLVNYNWNIGQQDLPVGDVFSQFTEGAGLRQGKVGLVTMHEYYNVASCTNYVTCTYRTDNYLKLNKNAFFTLTTALINAAGGKQPSPYFINSNGYIVNDHEDVTNKKYIYPVIVLPLDTMIIGGAGSSGSPYILKF